MYHLFCGFWKYGNFHKCSSSRKILINTIKYILYIVYISPLYIYYNIYIYICATVNNYILISLYKTYIYIYI